MEAVLPWPIRRHDRRNGRRRSRRRGLPWRRRHACSRTPGWTAIGCRRGRHRRRHRPFHRRDELRRSWLKSFPWWRRWLPTQPTERGSACEALRPVWPPWGAWVDHLGRDDLRYGNEPQPGDDLGPDRQGGVHLRPALDLLVDDGERHPAHQLGREAPAEAAVAAEAQVLLNASVDEPSAPPDDSRHLAYLFASTGNPLYQLRLAGVACPTPDSFLPAIGPRPKRYLLMCLPIRSVTPLPVRQKCCSFSLAAANGAGCAISEDDAP